MINIEYKDENIKQSVEKTSSNNIDYYLIHLSTDTPKPFPIVRIEFKYSSIDIASLWHPGAFRNKSLGMVWEDPENSSGFVSRTTSLAPVGCFINIENQNRLAAAFSDTINPVRYNFGIYEEDTSIKCRFVLFTESQIKRTEYTAILRVDRRDIPYYDVLRSIADWYETQQELPIASIPEEARGPVYSTWYGFHQNLDERDIEEECAAFREMGCKTLIVDDGWQTSDNKRGYGFCGDWEPQKDKIKNMKHHVQRVHDIGLKYILWYSVPFIGKYSKQWNLFKDMLLYERKDIQAGVVDPRFPVVREFIITTYEKALLNWNLDGFKLDFIDDFIPGESELHDVYHKPGQDYDSLQEAVDCLLSDIMSRLKKIKPGIMIEFRQRYIGPDMRKYGNIFRVGDCPLNYISNRVGVIDLRLFSGNTAVHSDMLAWSPSDSPEHAALQIINVLFGVPQISVRYHTLPESHKQMLRHWLSFWIKHRDILLKGQLKPLNPELLYPIVYSEKEEELLICIFTDRPVTIDKEFQRIYIINGALLKRIIISNRFTLQHCLVTAFNYSGKQVFRKEIRLSEKLIEISIPPSGYIKIEPLGNP